MSSDTFLLLGFLFSAAAITGMFVTLHNKPFDPGRFKFWMVVALLGTLLLVVSIVLALQENLAL
jgi:hypothetical protein